MADALGLAVGPPGVQLVDEVKAQIDFADTGRRLGLLDNEPLMWPASTERQRSAHTSPTRSPDFAMIAISGRRPMC